LSLRAPAVYDDDARRAHEEVMVRQHDKRLNVSGSVGGRDGGSMVQSDYAKCTDVYA